MKLTGVTHRCARLWSDGAAALIGISPFNSYFSAVRISEIVRHCGTAGRELAIFVPDDVTHFTLQARGYSRRDAERKTRRQVSYLRNKIERATGDRELPILGCRELQENDAYRASHSSFYRLFESDADFRRGCLTTTGWVLGGDRSESVARDAALLGVRYLLAELPMFLRAPEILGKEKVVFVYHQCPEFIRSLVGDPDRRHLSRGQGFGILTARRE